ncbi:MAG: S1 family peptidase [Lysobacteraceae bacterium]|nr:MAG: S1 family peptidase [Xanthomonadaceae bacterium]
MIRINHAYMEIYMRQSRFPLLSAPRTLALVMGLAIATPWVVSAAPPADPSQPGGPAMSKELLTAMRRDLGLDAQQAARYLDAERSAMTRIPEVKRRLGAAYAGSWLERGDDGRFRLVVASTRADAAAQVEDLAAKTQLVARSLAQLDAAKAGLDAIGKQRKPDRGIHTWYVDVKTNQVVVEADPMAQHAALDFVAASGVDAAAVRFVQSRGEPRPTNIIGGERYNLATGGWCSIGFPVTRGADTGFATAGHCGAVGTNTNGVNGIVQGTFAGSNFPGNDMAWVRITNQASWPLRNWVTNYAGGTVPIVGQQQAAIGAAVCRSGGNTGYRCGTITANNVTVNYAAGAVFGLTSSSACVGFGDSGGSFITPAGQAQGVTSGGQNLGANDNCAQNPPVTFHQPLVPLLNAYGLTLFTGAGGGAAPTITRFVCPNYNDSGAGRYWCFVEYTSATPANAVWSGASGTTYNSPGLSEFTGRCLSGQRLRLTVTVTNAAGSTARTSALFSCPTGPIP